MTDRRQAIFDLCAKHLLTQKKRSSVPNPKEEGCETCVYYKEENGETLMCGAAPVLDPQYMKEFGYLLRTSTGLCLMESSIKSVSREYPDALQQEFADLDNFEIDLLEEIQRIHDNWEPQEWRGQLRWLATKRCLNTSILETQP